MPARTVLFLALLAAPSIVAQTPAQNAVSATTEPTIHTAADLAQREAKITEAAKLSPIGFADMTLDDYGNDYTMLVVRLHTGEAERHQWFADEIVVLKGNFTLVTGGVMQGEHPGASAGRPGETRSPGMDGGKEVVLHTGDIAHIPAGITHWVKLAPGATTTYIVFKEKRSAQPLIPPKRASPTP